MQQWLRLDSIASAALVAVGIRRHEISLESQIGTVSATFFSCFRRQENFRSFAFWILHRRELF